MLIPVLGFIVLLLTGLCAALFLRVRHLLQQVDELCTQIGDRVADQYLLNEAQSELAAVKMQLETERRFNVQR